MATRATYQIDDTTFYCHWDGYPTGAAGRFAAMVESMTQPSAKGIEPIADRRGGFAFAFIRGVMDAEPTDRHDVHGDTEYRYTVKTAPDGAATISVDAYSFDSDKWSFKGSYDLARWLNVQRGNLLSELRRLKTMGGMYDGDPEIDAHDTIPPIVRVTISDGGRSRVVYATEEHARNIQALFQAKARTFQPDNPNRAGYQRRADAWLDALTQHQNASAA